MSTLIAAALFLYKLTHYFPLIPYAHLLVTYEHGFIRRAFVGALFALFSPDRVPVAAAYVIGLAAITVAFGLYLALVRRAYGSLRQHEVLALLCFTAGSPLLFKNFIQNIGYADVYGFTVGLLALLLPASSVYALVLTALCVILLLVHHLHALLYIPTIALIFFLRVYSARPLRLTDAGLAALSGAALLSTFVALMFFGAPHVPPDTFYASLVTRSEAPVPSHVLFMWYSDLRTEISATFELMPKNLLRVPVFAAVLLLHYPLFRVFKDMLPALPAGTRRLLTLGMLGLTLGYLVIFLMVFDYSRWVANWFACLVLCFHCAAMLSREAASLRKLAPNLPNTKRAAFALAVIPRLGTTIPF